MGRMADMHALRAALGGSRLLEDLSGSKRKQLHALHCTALHCTALRCTALHWAAGDLREPEYVEMRVPACVADVAGVACDAQFDAIIEEYRKSSRFWNPVLNRFAEGAASGPL